MMGFEYLMTVTLQHYLFIGFAVFAIGLLVVMIKKDFLMILMGLELMLNGVNVLAVSFSSYTNNLSGQIVTFFILILAAAEVGVGLIIALSIYRDFGKTEISEIEKLKG